jgi:hypothetical protein
VVRFGGCASAIAAGICLVPSKRTIWFPAKQYGWGWGPPVTWQGWAVIAAFIILMVAGGAYVMPTFGALAFAGYTFVLSAFLIAICWVKGEPPRWRWGDD